MGFPKISTWALLLPSAGTYFSFVGSYHAALSVDKTSFLVTSVEACTSNTNGSNSTAQHSVAQQYSTALTTMTPTLN